MNDPKEAPIMRRRKRIITAWRTLAPAAVLGGMTLEQFEEATKSSEEVRQRIDETIASLDALRLERDQADDKTRVKIADLVDAVKGHSEYGANSPLYSAFGYVPRDARKSGLTRKGPESSTESADAA